MKTKRERQENRHIDRETIKTKKGGRTGRQTSRQGDKEKGKARRANTAARLTWFTAGGVDVVVLGDGETAVVGGLLVKATLTRQLLRAVGQVEQGTAIEKPRSAQTVRICPPALFLAPNRSNSRNTKTKVQFLVVDCRL